MIFNQQIVQSGGGGNSYDIVIRCNNQNGFSNSKSDYEVLLGDYITVVEKYRTGEFVTGICYSAKKQYDDEDDIWSCEMYVLPLVRVSTSEYGNPPTSWEGDITFQMVVGTRYHQVVFHLSDDPEYATLTVNYSSGST